MKKTMCLFQLVFWSLLLLCHAEVPELHLPESMNPPHIDGILDDEIWKDATKITDLLQNNSKNMNTHQTSVLLSSCQFYMYVAFICQEPNMPTLQRKKADKQYDGAVWQDDCVEVYLGNPESPEQLSQVVVNWAGGRFDGISFPGKVMQPSNFHNFSWQSAVSTDNDSWTVEMAIPFFIAGIKPQHRSFRVNFFREKYHAPGEMLAWSRTEKNIFAVPERFGIVYKKAHTEVLPQLTDIQWPEFFFNSQPFNVNGLAICKNEWQGDLITGFSLDGGEIAVSQRKPFACIPGKLNAVDLSFQPAKLSSKTTFYIGTVTAGQEQIYWQNFQTLAIATEFELERFPELVLSGQNSYATAVFRQPNAKDFLRYTIFDKNDSPLLTEEFHSCPRLVFLLETANLRSGKYRVEIRINSGKQDRVLYVID